MKSLKHYLPVGSDIFPVYSVIVFWAYSWGVLIFMFNLSSWILKVPLGEILGYFSYGMLYVFLDTLLILAILLFFSAILPASWFRNDFPASGALAAGSLFFWLIFFQVSFNVVAELPPASILAVILVALLILILSLVISRRISWIHKALVWFGSATGIFVYLYLFLTALGLVVVLIRNIA